MLFFFQDSCSFPCSASPPPPPLHYVWIPLVKAFTRVQTFCPKSDRLGASTLKVSNLGTRVSILRRSTHPFDSLSLSRPPMKRSDLTSGGAETSRSSSQKAFLFCAGCPVHLIVRSASALLVFNLSSLLFMYMVPSLFLYPIPARREWLSIQVGSFLPSSVRDGR